MSDIQDLIHKTSMDCIERGKVIERERIIKLLDERITNLRKCLGSDCDCRNQAKIIDYAIELIKGETND
jgi:hypothetical protein